MIITASNENHSNEHPFCKDIETNSVSEDGSSCTGRIYIFFIQLNLYPKIDLDSTSSSMTLTSSSKTHFRLSNDDEEYVDDFDNDDEDDWKPKKKRRRITTTKKNKTKKKKNLVVVVSPSNSPIDFPNCIIPLNKLR
jgi:hypothetical protein